MKRLREYLQVKFLTALTISPMLLRWFATRHSTMKGLPGLEYAFLGLDQAGVIAELKGLSTKPSRRPSWCRRTSGSLSPRRCKTANEARQAAQGRAALGLVSQHRGAGLRLAGAPDASALLPIGRIAPGKCASAKAPADQGSVAYLLGEYQAFGVDGEQFATVPLELTEPVPIAHADLVILDAEREACEARNASARPRYTNTAEQRATALVIRALAVKAYGADALDHRYATAAKIATEVEFAGAAISRQAVANKLKAIAQLTSAGSD